MMFRNSPPPRTCGREWGSWGVARLIRGALACSAAGLLAAPTLAQGQRFYVDPTSTGPQIGDTWNRAFHTVQQGLAAAGNTAGVIDEIWVAQGTYTPGTLQTSTYTLKDNVKLYGGFTGYGSGTGSQESFLYQRPYPPVGSILSGDIDGTAGSSPGD